MMTCTADEIGQLEGDGLSEDVSRTTQYNSRRRSAEEDRRYSVLLFGSLMQYPQIRWMLKRGRAAKHRSEVRIAGV